MIKRLGWRRFLRLFWGTFRRKYFPEEDEWVSDPRRLSDWNSDRADGVILAYAITIGVVMLSEAVTVMSLGNPGTTKNIVAAILAICGLVPLSIPVKKAVSMMIEMEKHADEFFSELNLK